MTSLIVATLPRRNRPFSRDVGRNHSRVVHTANGSLRLRDWTAAFLLPLPPRSRLPARPITRPLRRTCPTFARPLALSRVCNCVVVVTLDCSVRFSPPLIQCFFRRIRRNQTVATASDQIRPAGFDQRLTNSKVVLRLEKLHERALQFAVVHGLGGGDRSLRNGVEPGVVHACRNVECLFTLHKVGYTVVG